MIRPPRGAWSFIRRNASRVQRNAPVRFTSTTRRHASIVRSSSGIAGAPVPALLKRTSRRPNVLPRRLEQGADRLRDRSRRSGRRGPGCAFAAARRAVSARASCRRPASTTEYPSASRARAVARPIPEPAPVTIAVFPNEFIASRPLSRVSRTCFRANFRYSWTRLIAVVSCLSCPESNDPNRDAGYEARVMKQVPATIGIYRLFSPSPLHDLTRHAPTKPRR